MRDSFAFTIDNDSVVIRLERMSVTTCGLRHGANPRRRAHARRKCARVVHVRQILYITRPSLAIALHAKYFLRFSSWILCHHPKDQLHLSIGLIVPRVLT